MKRIVLLVLSVVVLISSLILITTAVASGASGAITWYLDEDFHLPVDDPVLVGQTITAKGHHGFNPKLLLQVTLCLNSLPASYSLSD